MLIIFYDMVAGVGRPGIWKDAHPPSMRPCELWAEEGHKVGLVIAIKQQGHVSTTQLYPCWAFGEGHDSRANVGLRASPPLARDRASPSRALRGHTPRPALTPRLDELRLRRARRGHTLSSRSPEAHRVWSGCGQSL